LLPFVFFPCRQHGFIPSPLPGLAGGRKCHRRKPDTGFGQALSLSWMILPGISFISAGVLWVFLAFARIGIDGMVLLDGLVM